MGKLSINRLKVRITSFLICALFFVPPLIFVPGRFNDSWIFVNYREPKLVAVQILAWLLITWSTIAHFKELKAIPLHVSASSKIIFAFLCLLALYISLSAIWAPVPEAVFYEAHQWGTLCILFYVLLALFLASKHFREVALCALILSFAVVTIIGLIQTQVELPFLMPVVKTHPFSSTFGAKNTCFVTLASQIFLLLYLAIKKFLENKRLFSFLWGFVLIIELSYIFISYSRTTYAAMAVGFLLFWSLLFYTHQIRFSKKLCVIITSCIVAVGLLIVTGVIRGIGPNMVVNPGFEIGLDKTKKPKAWIFYPHKFTKHLGKWSDKIKYSGDYSVVIIGKEKLQIGWKGKPIFFESTHPKMVLFSGWSKAENVNQCGKNYSLLFKINFVDHSYTWYRPPKLNFSCGTHDWEFKSAISYWHKPITSIQPYCILYNSSGKAWFDDISVRQCNASLAFLNNFYITWKDRILTYFRDPKRFFTETARGAAILDTWEMFREHPLGVGAGNWGFVYPLYHKHMLKKSFSESIQIRRAHNDFAEFLGETGLIGLVIVLLFIFYILRKLFSLLKENFVSLNLILSICLIAQFIVLLISMSLTFYLEYPYRKFLFVFFMVLVCAFIEFVKNKRQYKNTAFC